jgi:branched-chain amino acid transport system substrate-binding protein
MLLMSGCQTSKISDWLQGQNSGPKATAPPSQETRGPLPSSKVPSPKQLKNSPENIQFPFDSLPVIEAPRKTEALIVLPSPKMKFPDVPQSSILLPQFSKEATATSFSENGRTWPSLKPFLKKPQKDITQASRLTSTLPQPSQDSVRVGLLLPLSGSNAKLGQAMLNAAQLAVFNFADKRFELLVHDTQGTPQGASHAASSAISDGASMILGPLLAASVRAVGPLAQSANVPVAAFSSDRSVVGDGTFTMGFLPSAEIWRIIVFAKSKGIKRFAALAPNNEYGETVIDAFEAAVSSNGGTVNRVQYYDPSANDFSPAVRQLADYDIRRAALLKQRKDLEDSDNEVSRRALKRLEPLQTIGDLPFDALLLAASGERLLSIAALLPFYDIDPGKIRMLGTGQWDVPGLGAEPALIDGWFAAPSPKARINFMNTYKATYGEESPRLATLAYDATALAAVLGQNKSGPDFSLLAITKPSGFWGRDGIFRFLPSGIVERGLAVMKVDRRNSRVLSKAPETFQAQIN